MKVLVKKPAVTYVDGIATSLNLGEEIDLPTAKAGALIKAGIVARVEPVQVDPTKAPATKVATTPATKTA